MNFRYNSLVLNGFAKEIMVTEFFDNVSLYSNGLSNFEISINKIGEVGKVESKIFLVSIEPIFALIKIIPNFFEIYSEIMQ